MAKHKTNLLLKHLVVALGLLVGCKTTSIHDPQNDWAYFEDWDKDKNVSLNLQEFVEGYVASGFIEKWQERKEATSDSVFLLRNFAHLDRNDNHSLDSAEYSSRRVLWSFQGTRNISKWDNDHDKIIALDEFLKKAKSEQVVLGFDVNADGEITEEEMAQGMFAVCDKNDDNLVRPKEFYVWEVYRR